MAQTEADRGQSAGQNLDGNNDGLLAGASPARINSPELRLEAKRAGVWVAVVGTTVLAIYISQSILVIFGAMVFAAMVDGGARLIAPVIPLGRTWRIAIVLLATISFFVWLGYFAGSQISQEAAQLPSIIEEQAQAFFNWLSSQGFSIKTSDVEAIFGQAVSSFGTVTRALGGLLGGLTTLLLIVIIGIYVVLEPRLYERGIAWMLPKHRRSEFFETCSQMAATMRRLMAGRVIGMVFEGFITWLMLWAYGVPMAALLGILTGLLAFLPNIGAFISGILMVLVGFSGGVEMGLYTIFVYLLVQTFDGYVVIPLIAKKTVDLAPALVLTAQLIMGMLFGIMGLFLADPLMAMIKVALERRSKSREIEITQYDSSGLPPASKKSPNA